MDGQVKVAVIYYSATGITYQMAQAACEAAGEAGAEVRLRKVRELAPDEAIRSNAGWQAHRLETQDVMEAEIDDLAWADVVIFGSPTRYGMIAAQLKQFIDTTGPLWANGALADKVYSAFTSTATSHGGQESTLLSLFTIFYHWGGVVVTPGYTDPSQFVAGNPYGASHTSNNGEIAPDHVALAATALTAKRAVRIGAGVKRGLAAG
ncbi:MULTISPECIES: NAD(P)H:quinone oxidoreductase [Micromonospora]|jgi:NAD(P)H dehydrogenase (quinone)|uniref:NAD(P)H dehydrogenase (Quinone) n=1 Tax=Micromonospora rifamycinica TaxID=291594 RepID=A0A109IKB3_9ACTN|nr:MULTISPECIES: NAD(P)H:quinone oxidoreductase [Micromonospora]KWV32112.1 NAD(P)H dehydrogenase [Micromonospora rifamycinica]WFE66804.1 NAD(P)H:quinone oxidoreductase [Micromonospora sp. WMMD714]WFE93756.1 NAD(P)H:quinone oxidoreductase [Micromonospora sp. WMMD987]SCG81325.1 NAD(P)H dehydrogenase (quinone) [Micromonospora rifamycinica]